jgi:hypothetical protein
MYLSKVDMPKKKIRWANSVAFRETLKKEIAFIPSSLRAIKGGGSKDLNPWIR